MGIIEDIQELGNRIDEIAKMSETDRKEYIRVLKSSFSQIQKAVYPIISEEGAIMERFKFKEVTHDYKLTPQDILGIAQNFSKHFALAYGYDETTVLGLVESKNRLEASVFLKNPNSYCTFRYWILTSK